MNLHLLAIGEVMAEIRREPAAGFRVGFAGDTFNTAVYCAREFGPSARIGYCTRVGCDPLSLAFLNAAKDEGIDVSQVELDRERNIGIYAVSTDDTGERSFHYWRGDSAARRLFASGETLDSLPAASVVYLSGITLAILHPSARKRLIAHLRDLRGRGACHVAFDSNYRPQLWEDAATARRSVREMWRVADIALPSVDDEIALFGDADEEAAIARFAAAELRACAIKRGGAWPGIPAARPRCASRIRPFSRRRRHDRGRGQFQRRLPGGVPSRRRRKTMPPGRVTRSLPGWWARRVR